MPNSALEPGVSALSESRQRVRERVFTTVTSYAERDRSSGVLRRNIAASLARLDGMDISTPHEDLEPEEPAAPNEEKAYHFIMNFLEVEQTLQRLDILEYYFRRFPFAGTPVTKVDHLRIAIELYLNEIYIYRCRIKNLLNSTQDAYGSKIDNLWRAFKIIDRYLDRFLRARNWNVHKMRFSDEDVDLLNLLDLLSHSGDSFEAPANFAYKQIRKKWIKLARRNSVDLARTFELVCSIMEPHLDQILRNEVP